MEKDLIKIKPMQKDEIVLAIDRLTRFKYPQIKYNRVFRELISKYLIEPKIGFKKYDELGAEKNFFVEKIFEKSLEYLGVENLSSSFLNDCIFEYESGLFDIDEETKALMGAKIPFDSVMELLEDKDLSLNLLFLKRLYEKRLDFDVIRKKYSTKFPIKKVLLVEGITEEILLPKFSKVLGFDFDNEGVEIIAAGGKNQVAKLYLQLYSVLKCPIMVLLDADGEEVAQKISLKLRETDKLVLIDSGEFEDILPLALIKKAINFKYKNFFELNVEDLKTNGSMVRRLETVYRENSLGEFKKAEFAFLIASLLNDKSANSISDGIRSIVEEIEST